jgi:hypothetical protein
MAWNAGVIETVAREEDVSQCDENGVHQQGGFCEKFDRFAQNFSIMS